MMRHSVLFALPLVAFAALASVPATSQPADSPAFAPMVANEANDTTAINRVKQAVAGRRANEILSISGTQKIDDQVIFVDTLRFDNDAKMQLKAGNRDAIYIVARELRLSGPSFKGTIEFYDREAEHGDDGAAPAAARPRLPRSGGNGSHGASGQRGNPGEAGKTRKLPTIYLVTGRIRQSTGGEPDFSDLRIRADGIDGGDGGAGGKGQAGQGGQDGRHGKANMGICSRSPKSGGNGGKGGDYGPGGVGGNGGNGGNVVFIVPPETVDAIKDVRVRNRGGLVGAGGKHGEPGAGGNGGSRGSRPGTCDGGRPGSKGAAGAKAPTMRADDGSNEGKRGRTYYHVANFFS